MKSILSSKREGASLIEVLVLIFVIFIGGFLLLSLLTPSMGRRSGPSYRTICINNMRNVGLAIIQYEAKHQCLPSIRGQRVKQGADYSIDTRKPGTWVFEILPYLERSDLYRTFGEGGPRETKDYEFIHQIPIEVLTCPNDTTTLDQGSNLSYVVSAGCRDSFSDFANPGWGAFNTAVGWNSVEVEPQANGVFGDGYGFLDTKNQIYIESPKRTSGYVAAHDGSSQTIMLTENIDAFRWSGEKQGTNPQALAYREGAVALCWVDIDPKTERRGNASTLFNHGPGETGDRHNLPRPSSYHPGGCVFTFADGHTVFIDEDIDYKVFQALCTPFGKEATKLDQQTGKYVPARQIYRDYDMYKDGIQF